MTATVIALGSQKGGVGKTTVTFHLSAELARRGLRVLAIDADPQASLSAMAGVDVDEGNSLAEVLGSAQPGSMDVSTIVQPTDAGFYIAASDIGLASTELYLVNRRARELQLRRALAPALRHYDYILVDCPPSLSLLTVNALVASDWTICPVVPDIVSLRGVGLYVDTVRGLRADFEQSADLLGVVATLVDRRGRHARQILEVLRDRADLLPFKTVIPKTTRMPEAAMAFTPIYRFEPGGPAAMAFVELATEVLDRVAA